MTTTAPFGWDPERYLEFAHERARPFAELVARVGAESPRSVVDLGCGTGDLTALLTRRWPSASVLGVDLSVRHAPLGVELANVTQYYYLFLAMVVASVLICHRLERSRIGRAWMAIREDEVAARAMGIDTRNLKLLAFGMGATFGGVSGVLFASLEQFVSPQSFGLQESVMIVAMVVLGGMGHLPGVILGAVLLAALPEVLRHVVGPLRQISGDRIDANVLRQLLIALAMIGIMLVRPRGLWPAPEHGQAAPGTRRERP